MRDPLDALRDLDPGEPMDSLPASEVRRRGDLRRRRRAATVAVGAALAATLAVLPFTTFGEPPPPEPATPPTTAEPTTDPNPDGSGPISEWRTEIPDDFTLEPQIEGYTEARTWVVDDDAIGVGTIELCGMATFDTDGVLDRLAADAAPDGESADAAGRELRVYTDDGAAEEAIRRVEDAVAACPKEEVDGAVWTHLPMTVSGTPGEQHVAFSRTFEVDGQTAPGVELWALVRVGNAVLGFFLSLDHGDLSSGVPIAEITTPLAAVTGSLCVFSPGGCVAPEPTDAGPDLPGMIPADFPIDRYLPTGDDYQRIDPNAGDDGIELCGEWIWPAEAAEAYGAMVVGPELVEIRWVGNYGDATLAAAVLESARDVLDRCEATGADDALAVSVIDVSTGYDDVTFAVTEADGRPGGEVYQLMRVGHAVLVSTSGGEYTTASATGAAERLTTQSADLAQDMCVFTEAGC